MRWLVVLSLLVGCAASQTYTHVIEVSGGMSTPRLDCVQPRITLVGPDSVAWREVHVANIELLPAYDCGLGGGGEEQGDNPGGLQ